MVRWWHWLRNRLPCVLYSLLFWFKQTRLAGWLFFDGGQPFRVLEKNVTVVGRVLDFSWHEADGDRTFNILVEPPWQTVSSTFHCEITPCTADACATFMHYVKVGDRVLVTGDHCFDPPHFGTNGGGHEVHPVRQAWIVTPPPAA